MYLKLSTPPDPSAKLLCSIITADLVNFRQNVFEGKIKHDAICTRLISPSTDEENEDWTAKFYRQKIES